jgi:hypothetical protein
MEDVLPTSTQDPKWKAAVERALEEVKASSGVAAESPQLHHDAIASWLQGARPAHLPVSNAVRLFTSSTFVDTQCERNVMLQLVFPCVRLPPPRKVFHSLHTHPPLCCVPGI